MRYTFNLKSPKSNKETLIMFSSFFKNEGKKFVYSTGEKIHPEEWDFKLRQPNNTTGRSTQADNHRTIKRQLDRFGDLFIKIVNKYKDVDEEITIELVKEEINKSLKKVESNANNFFAVYDKFIKHKEEDKSDASNSITTIRRYKYNKTLLEQFEKHSKSTLHFSKINNNFYNSFLDYCITQKGHSANTLRRNIGLLKTFLNWALENKFTYKIDFKKFKTPKGQVTDEIALTFDQVKEVYEFDFSDNTKLERVRDLFVLGCSTGMRISNYSKIKSNDIVGGYIIVHDRKNTGKQLRVPLNDFSIEILEKYNYDLPVYSTQKFNEYIKDVFKAIGYDNTVKKTIRIGSEVIEKDYLFYKRISSHTARRSFITIMKNKKIPDKVIMEFTGHKSLEVFNKYYKPNDDDKKDFMKDVWKM
ncbi:MAG: tyrosine-type recombinase/integrase [Bacteroidota bacterium]